MFPRRNLWKGGCAMVAGLSSRQVSGPAYVPAASVPRATTPRRMMAVPAAMSATVGVRGNGLARPAQPVGIVFRGRRCLSRFLAKLSVPTITSGPVHVLQPVREPFDVDSSFAVDDLCDFPIMVDAHLEGTNAFYVDHSETLRRISVHVREQDTFSANGTVLVGLPFRFNQEILFDENGVVEHAYASGVVEWVPLPDGTTTMPRAASTLSSMAQTM